MVIPGLDSERRLAAAAVFMMLSWSGPSSAVERGVAVRTPVTAETASVAASSGISETYGSFRWMVVRRETVAELRSKGITFDVVDDPYTLTLGGRRFDPMTDGDDVPLGWRSVARSGADLHLVQAHAPIRSAWLADLERSGLVPIQYIHPFTYVVWGETSAAEHVTALSWVRWTGAFHPAYRLLPRWRSSAGSEVDAAVVVPDIAEPASIADSLLLAGARIGDHRPIGGGWTVIQATVPTHRLADAAAVPGVYSIQPVPTDGGARGEMSNQICAGNTDGGNLAYPGYLDWLTAIDLDGDGVVMANVDQGIDESHPDLAGRFLPCSGATCGGAASSSHGTHTAGIQTGTGASGNTLLGFLRGLGVAPGASLVEQIYYPTYSQPGGMSLLIEESSANGAVLSSNSWGPSGSPRGYDADTLQVDLGVRDAESATGGLQAFSYILSVMNGYGGVSSQGTPDEAKNAVTVGSTRMQLFDGTQLAEIDDISANSAHGPALDGRTIPHLVAPGCRVDSTVPGAFGLNCGTSMASPHVSGSAALLIERWRSTSVADPSPAMLKAELLVTARSLAGNLDADGGTLGHPFDSKQGWGRLDTGSLVQPPESRAVFDDPALLTDTGQEWVHTLAADDPARPVRIMLVWTDAPGHGLGGATPAWNNDLDLVVEAAGVAYHGNSFGHDGWSTAGGGFDGANNTEGVFLPPGTAAEITIRVRASNLPSDGVPGNTHPTDQDFAVAVVNGVQAPCSPGTFFDGEPGVTDAEIGGAQVFVLDWPVATTRCGGALAYTVFDARLGEPGAPLLGTDETQTSIVGASPGVKHCWVIGASEDGVPGQSIGPVCLTGTADRTAGDLDCSGEVSTRDLLDLVGVVFGAAEPLCAGHPAADADLDGVVDAADAAQIVRAVHDPL